MGQHTALPKISTGFALTIFILLVCNIVYINGIYDDPNLPNIGGAIMFSADIILTIIIGAYLLYSSCLATGCCVMSDSDDKYLIDAMIGVIIAIITLIMLIFNCTYLGQINKIVGSGYGIAIFTVDIVTLILTCLYIPIMIVAMIVLSAASAVATVK